MQRKLAVITPVFPSKGEEHRGTFIYHKIRPLARQLDVAIYCVASRSTFHRLRYKDYQAPQVRVPLDDLAAKFLSYPHIPVLTRGINGDLVAAAVRDSIIAQKPEAILAYWIYPHGYAALKLSRELNIPCVIGALGSDLRILPDLFTARMVRKTVREAACITTVSEDLRQRAISLGASPDQVHTILNGCDHSIFYPMDRGAARAELGVPADSELILFVGWLLKLKGVHDLLGAMELLLKRRPKANLVMIGDGAEEKHLRRRIAQIGAQPRIFLRGREKSREIARWLAAANLLCLPSYSEGCPNVVLEALCCGRPVVASNVGGIPEIVSGQCAILTPPGDSTRLAEALNQALDRSWDEHAIVQAHGRSWDDVANKTLGLLNSLLLEPSHAAIS
jgi:teichuronic acid biosynthesis glycosyltransferase TuaC